MGNLSFYAFLTHLNLKKSLIIKQQSFKTVDEMVDYFDFENMSKYQKHFCILYKTGTKCHEIQNLNCFFCACPFYVVQDEKHTFCKINSKFASYIVLDDLNICDCTNCHFIHKKFVVNKLVRKFYIKQKG